MSISGNLALATNRQAEFERQAGLSLQVRSARAQASPRRRGSARLSRLGLRPGRWPHGRPLGLWRPQREIPA
jgi:hypothetical protein